MSDLNFDIELDTDLGELRAMVRELKNAKNVLGELDKSKLTGVDKAFARAGKKGSFFGSMLDDLGGRTVGFDRSIASAAGAGAFFGTVLGGIAMKAVEVGVALARMAASAAVAFGGMVLDAAEFAQQQKLSFGLLLKSEAAGAAAFNDTRKLAQRLGLDVRATTDQFRELLAMQFSMGQATDIVKMSADMQALGADAQKVESTIRAITQVKGKGKLQMDELTNQLAEAGIATDMVIKQLAEMRKVGPDAIRKMISAGKIGADEGVKAIQLAVMEKLGIKTLGEAGEKFADSTIKGMRNKLKGAWDNLWLDLGERIEKPLMDAMAPIAKDLLAFMEGAEGKSMVDSIVGGIRTLATVVKEAWPVVKQMMGAFKEGFGAGLEGLGPAVDAFKQAFGGDNKAALEGIASAVKVLGFGLGITIRFFVDAAAAVGQFIGELSQLWSAIDNAIESVKSGSVGLGTGVIDGFVSGITSGAQRVVAAVKGVATSAINAGVNVLKIGSPSKEFEWMGEMTSLGFAQGVDVGAPDAAASMANVVSPPSVAAAAARGGGGGATTNNTVTVHVTVNGATGEANIEDAVRRGVEQALDQLAE